MPEEAEGGEGVTTSPWHSIKQNVHHNNTDCPEGNNIEPENRRSGTGGKPLCDRCENL
jgi:hypothetical protein